MQIDIIQTLHTEMGRRMWNSKGESSFTYVMICMFGTIFASTLLKVKPLHPYF